MASIGNPHKILWILAFLVSSNGFPMVFCGFAMDLLQVSLGFPVHSAKLLPGVRVLESDDWRNLNSNTPSCTALEKMAKFKQEKEMLRTLRKTKTSKARNDPNQFRPSWMQIDKPKRKPGEGVPTTALPQASLKSNAIKSGEEEEKRRRLRRRLKAMARLSPLTSKLEVGEEPDWSQVRSLRKKVKKLSKEIQGGSRLLKSMKMKRDLF